MRAEAVPETPRNQEPRISRQRVLIVIGVVVAAAVFGRAMGGREPALHGDAHVRSVIDSPQHSVPPVRETPPDAVVGDLPTRPVGSSRAAIGAFGAAPWPWRLNRQSSSIGGFQRRSCGDDRTG